MIKLVKNYFKQNATIDIKAFKVDEIRINKKPKGKIIRFPFCGHCGFLINKSFDSDYINLMNQFNPAQPKN